MYGISKALTGSRQSPQYRSRKFDLADRGSIRDDSYSLSEKADSQPPVHIPFSDASETLFLCYEKVKKLVCYPISNKKGKFQKMQKYIFVLFLTETRKKKRT